MKRSAFKRKLPQWQEKSKQWSGPDVKPRRPVLRVVQRDASPRAPIPKIKPLRDERYRRWVASLACAHCGRPGPSQCAHADSGGKGMGTKSPDSECLPLCADSAGGRRGCHSLIGASGMFSKEQRRALEADYSQRTRELAKAKGAWPPGWP